MRLAKPSSVIASVDGDHRHLDVGGRALDGAFSAIRSAICRRW
jgi:hypothetical protein